MCILSNLVSFFNHNKLKSFWFASGYLIVMVMLFCSSIESWI
jgi:hypothetical protein